MTLSRDEATELAQSVRTACGRLEAGRLERFAFGDEAGSFDDDLWRQLCQQIGIAEIALPACRGAGADALGVVAHELGRALAPVPFLASAVLATGLLVDFGCDDGVLEPLLTGARTAAAIVTASGGAWDPAALSITARRDCDDWSVSGMARHVLHGHGADDYVVIAEADGEHATFLVDAHSSGTTITTERVLDGTRPMATVTFAGARAHRLSQPGRSSADTVKRQVDRTLAVLAAEQVGTAERLLEITTDYARTRHQFGRPIGGFQAVKHSLANMLIDLEWARSAARASLKAIDNETGDLAWQASMAKSVCSEMLRDSAHAAVQLHGGIGFSWEGPVHPHLRRARTDEVLFGGPSHHWNRLASEVVDAGLAPALSILGRLQSAAEKTAESGSHA